MPRIRFIKHEFFLDDKLASQTAHARLLFIGLWTLADREGRLEDNPKRIKAQLFPYEELDIDHTLSELACGFITRYEVVGKKCIQINNFLKHQRAHPKEPISTIPVLAGKKHGKKFKNTARNLKDSTSRVGNGEWVMGNGVVGNGHCPKEPAPVARGGDMAKKIKHDLETVKAIVSLYLELTGKGKSDIAQDSGGWGRWMIAADKLLGEFKGRRDLAEECLQERAAEWAKLPDWTLDRVVTRAQDWLAIKQSQENALR